MTKTTEFIVDEVITAVIDSTIAETGDPSFMGSLIFGFYKSTTDDGNPEIWVEQEGARVQFQAADLRAVIKQLKRAEKLAKEPQ